MGGISNVSELNDKILLLEEKQGQELSLLKEQFEITYESLKPVNLLKSSFKEIVTSPDLKEDLLNATIGFSAGYVSSKIVIGSTNNPFKQVLGRLLQMVVTSIVSMNVDSIRSKISGLLIKVLKNKTK